MSRLLVWCAVVVAVTWGCGGEQPAPMPTVAVVKKGPAPPPAAPSLPAALMSESGPVLPAYDSEGRRDPFRQVQRLTAEEKRITLDAMEPAELRLVGVIQSPSGYTAVLQAQDGRGYTAVVGSKVGRRGGVVKAILERQVVIVESYTDNTGLSRSRPVVLKLRAAEQGKS